MYGLASHSRQRCSTDMRHWELLQHTQAHCNTLQHTVTHYNLCNTICIDLLHTTGSAAAKIRGTENSCNPLQHTATTLQHTAAHCNTLPHTATCAPPYVLTFYPQQAALQQKYTALSVAQDFLAADKSALELDRNRATLRIQVRGINQSIKSIN